jgi:hypothetical protein
VLKAFRVQVESKEFRVMLDHKENKEQQGLREHRVYKD